jgi:predicted nucleic acid-binding protein
MALNLFIDTNVLLSFYHFSSDDLEELNKLIVLLDQGKVHLWMPKQVFDEFWRNRENKVNEALKTLQQQKMNSRFPTIGKDYEEYSLLRQHQKEYEKAHGKLVEHIKRDVAEKQLKADKIVQGLFRKAKRIERTEKIVRAARERFEVGNPPGKRGSLGDAINWETLLDSAPSNEPLHYVTDDKDYRSIIDSKQFNPYLFDEWKKLKGAEIVFYERMSEFFKDHFPQIKFAHELEKDLLIQDLESSGFFYMTHSVISRLRQFTDFTPAQINNIVDAAIQNTQVRWIIDDPDIKEFYTSLISKYEASIEESKLDTLKLLLNPANETEFAEAE